LLDPNFHKQKLIDVNSYYFITHELAESLITDIDQDTIGIFGQNSDRSQVTGESAPFELVPTRENMTLLSALNIPVDDIVASVNRVFPSPWLKIETEKAIDDFYSYTLGHSERFVIAPDLSNTTKYLIHEAKVVQGQLIASAYDLIMSEGFGYRADPIALDLQEAFGRAVSREWIIEKSSSDLDKVFDYLSGDEDSFKIGFGIQDRSDEIHEEFGPIIYKVTQEMVTNEVDRVKNAAHSDYKDGIDINSSISISNDDIVQIIGETLNYDWRRKTSLDITESIVDYLLNQRSSLQLDVVMSDRHSIALQSSKQIVAEKLDEWVSSLPVCKGKAPIVIDMEIACVPSWTNRKTVVDLATLSSDNVVNGLVFEVIPESIGVTPNYMLVRSLDSLHEILGFEFTLTQNDLQQNISYDDLATTKSIFNNSWSYTWDDRNEFRENYIVRNTFSVASNTYILYSILGLLLIIIGLLAGRVWWSKLAWPFLSLALSSLAIFLLTANLLEPFTVRYLSDYVNENAKDASYTDSIIIEKLVEILTSSLQDIFNGIKGLSLKCWATGSILTMALFLWMGFSRRRNTARIYD
tara:strand:- start:7696 stop:9435 length:1740 start_codon:yes stop_codon:yes gene_type:complete